LPKFKEEEEGKPVQKLELIRQETRKKSALSPLQQKKITSDSTVRDAYHSMNNSSIPVLEEDKSVIDNQRSGESPYFRQNSPERLQIPKKKKKRKQQP